MRTLLASLSGKSYQGRVPAGDVGQRVQAYLFADPQAPDGRGTIVIWTDSDASEGDGSDRVALEMNLGPGAEQVDLWGNRRPLTQSASKQREGRADVQVGRLPSFVVGVDAPMTRIRQTVRLDDPLIESSFRPHPRMLLMTNTFNRPISGTIRLETPEGWTADLPSRSFSLNPGETMVRPVELLIPYNSDAGRHRINVSIHLRAGSGGGGGGSVGTGDRGRRRSHRGAGGGAECARRGSSGPGKRRPADAQPARRGGPRGRANHHELRLGADRLRSVRARAVTQHVRSDS